MKHLALIAAFFVGALYLNSCKSKPTPDKEPTPVVVPPTYDFNNTDLIAGLELLNQLAEMVNYLNTADQPGVELSADVLRTMFENKGGNANGNFPFTSQQQLKALCEAAAQASLDGYFTKIAGSSAKVDTGANGKAGWVANAESTRHRLFDEAGWDHAQLIEKTIMGAVLYHQSVAVLINAENMDSAHLHWDMAYALFGASTEFPVDMETTRFWAHYAKILDTQLTLVDSLGHALRKGRAAINALRWDKRNEAISEVRKAWDKLCVGAAIHHINIALANLQDNFTRNHALSQAVAFARNAQYNPESTLTVSDIEKVESLVGANLYEATEENLVSARDRLAAAIGLDAETRTKL